MKKQLLIALMFITATSFNELPHKKFTKYSVYSARLVFDDVEACNKWLVSNIAIYEKECRMDKMVKDLFEEYYIEKYNSKCGVREIYGKPFYTSEEAAAYRTKLISTYKDKGREIQLTEGFVIKCK